MTRFSALFLFTLTFMPQAALAQTGCSGGSRATGNVYRADAQT